MLPSKRPSPFQRARSFQNSHARRGATRADENDGSPLPKRSGFARALSGPFQVLSPSLKMAKNPFEKLVPLSPLTGCSEFPVSEERRPFTVKKEDEDAEEDEALDPNRTLSLFSASQSNTTNSLEHASLPDDSDEEELLDDLEQEPSNSKSSSLSDLNADVPLESRKPRLHEALAMASIGKRTQVARELPAPEISSNSSKKMGTEHKTSHAVPIDWTLKSSLSITSPDSLMWCDSGSTLDEVEAMQRFVSKPGSFLLNKEVDSLSASTSARTRLLAATYHWAYPTNTPTLPQAQSITRLLKNTNNMTSGEKNSISELFSRSAEWKQAFEALYRSCRHGACVYFYYVGTTWTILFQHESVSLSGEIEAVLTNSTPGLRKVLQDEDIKFERLPDVTRKTTVHNFSSKHDLENFDDHDYEEGSVSVANQNTFTHVYIGI
ncbi:hypothetical protein EDD11_004029 [Mortierella claussenii]|nr:hypothetical protein EDD11_004029 [Mortierella claussenii]